MGRTKKKKLKNKKKWKTRTRKTEIIEDNTFETIGELMINTKALSKIFSYTNAVETEVGGLLVIGKHEGKPIVEDALLFEQTASYGDMELNAEKLAIEIQAMAIKEPRKIEKLCAWWHSHNEMDTFWSTTDDACFRNFLNVGSIAYGIVVNKQGSIQTRVDVKTDRGIFRNEDIKLVPHVSTMIAKYMAEAREKVKVFKPKYNPEAYVYPENGVYCKNKNNKVYPKGYAKSPYAYGWDYIWD